VASVIGGCSTLNAEPPNELPYGCNELVVIGQIATLGEESISDADASLPNWRSEWQLSIKIKRIVRGVEQRSVVPATGISHAQIRGDRDFLVVLRPVDGGTYALETATLWDVRPRSRLTEPCS
jgi:hypothetical protein